MDRLLEDGWMMVNVNGWIEITGWMQDGWMDGYMEE